MRIPSAASRHWRLLLRGGALSLCLFIASIMLAIYAGAPTARAHAHAIAYGPPVKITAGGTYTGNWQSTDANTPAVTVATTAPVIILDANIQSAANFIVAGVGGVNITVRDSNAYALNPNDTTKYPGRFVSLDGPSNLDVENDFLKGTSGIYVNGFNGNGSPGQTIKILRNRARNIDGRFSDGHDGFLTGPNDFYRVQFAQLGNVRHLANMEIGWNEVINQPGQSRVEDNINIYLTSGTATSPLKIHDNYIQGAYPALPGKLSYSGGGIMLGDGDSDWTPDKNVDEATGFVVAYDNQVVSTANYGLSIAAGHDDQIYNNRVVSSGYLADGTYIAASYGSGVTVWDSYGDIPKGTFFNNAAHDNSAGLVRQDKNGANMRADYWTPNCANDAQGQSLCTNNAGLSDPITSMTEQAEYSRWQQKVAANGVTIGPPVAVVPTATKVATATVTVTATVAATTATTATTAAGITTNTTTTRPQHAATSANWLLVALLVLFLASGGAGGYLWWRRRQAPATPPDDWQTDTLAGIGMAAPSADRWENEQDWVTPAGQFQRPASRSVDEWHAHEDWER